MIDEQIFRITRGLKRRLRIGDLEIPCFVLENGVRILSARGMQAALALGDHGSFFRAFSSRTDLKTFVKADLSMALEHPIRFVRGGGGKPTIGYEATILADICYAVLSAQEKGALSGAGLLIAKRCELLTRAFATVGIKALIDEATGYERIRDRQALEDILDKHIRSDLAEWAKRFSDEFYEHMFRLRGWKYRPLSVDPPGAVGQLTVDIVYARLEPGTLAELQRLTQLNASGRRKRKLQLASDVGQPALGRHVSNVTFLMKAAPNWEWFYEALQRAAPRYIAQLSVLAPHQVLREEEAEALH